MSERALLQPTSGRRVLVVDDEAPLAELVASYLRRDAFEVTVAHAGPAALAAARRLPPDVLVLDLGLPGLDGLEVCRQVRQFSDCYVVMLTARSDETEVLHGLASGADDYLTKPFSPRELVARVHAMLRRPRRPVPPPAAPMPAPRCFGDLQVDVAAREVVLAGRPVALTRTEFDLMAVLSAHPGQVLSRSVLIAQIWGPGWVGDEHLVDVHVANLRRKLGDTAEQARYVRTVRGVGYRMGSG